MICENCTTNISLKFNISLICDPGHFTFGKNTDICMTLARYVFKI
jgi:hypothetical protein